MVPRSLERHGIAKAKSCLVWLSDAMAQQSEATAEQVMEWKRNATAEKREARQRQSREMIA